MSGFLRYCRGRWYQYCVRRGEVALGHGEVIDGVPQVGFTRPVAARNAVDSGRKGELRVGYIAEVVKKNLFQVHTETIASQMYEFICTNFILAVSHFCSIFARYF